MIQFNNFSLQDQNYIVTELIYRSAPTRVLEAQKITRRPGIQYVENEFGERKINIQGAILGNSASDLQDKIDALVQSVVRVSSGLFQTDNGRTINSVVENFSVSDPHYTQSYVPYTMDLVCLDPFFLGNQQTISLTVASGISSMTIATTISGSVYAEPNLTYYAPAGSGNTTTSGIYIANGLTGEVISWSGTGGTNRLKYSDVINFDWNNQVIIKNLANVEPDGVFFRWEPIDTTFTVTFSGTTQGGTLELTYQPRYI